MDRSHADGEMVGRRSGTAWCNLRKRTSGSEGKYRVAFAPPGKTPWVETGEYFEVVALKRLVYQETVTQNDKLVHTNRTQIDFRDLGGKTEVIVTTSGFESWRNADGWVPALEKLAIALAA